MCACTLNDERYLKIDQKGGIRQCRSLYPRRPLLTLYPSLSLPSPLPLSLTLSLQMFRAVGRGTGELESIIREQTEAENIQPYRPIQPREARDNGEAQQVSREHGVACENDRYKEAGLTTINYVPLFLTHSLLPSASHRGQSRVAAQQWPPSGPSRPGWGCQGSPEEESSRSRKPVVHCNRPQPTTRCTMRRARRLTRPRQCGPRSRKQVIHH